MAPRLIQGALRGLARKPGAVPVFALVLLALVLGAAEGGYPTTTWYPAALLLLGLLGAMLFAVPPRDVPRPVVYALLLLAAFTAWSFLSIAWAGQPGAAWDGANRTLAYLIVFALAALWPITGRAAMFALALFGIGVAGIGLVELLRAAGAADPNGYFVYARLAEPVGYQNGNVAFWMLGFFPCVFCASRRELHPLMRGAAFAGAGMLIAMAAMGQSRGWLFALPVVTLLFVAVTPGRARLIVTLFLVALGAALFLGPVLSVHDDWDFGQPLNPLLDDARNAVLPVVAAMFLLGTAAAFLDRRTKLAEARAHTASKVVVIGTAAVLTIGVLGVLVAADDPAGQVSDAWHEFKGGQADPTGGSRFTASLGSNRYEFWSVAWDLFKDKPLNGIGTENFQLEYLRSGNSGESPRYAHSLELGVLSQTGLIGFLLLAGALGCGVWMALQAALRGRGLEAAAAGAALATFGWWFVHGSVDWFWEFPALAGSAFLMLGMAGALAPRDPLARRQAPRGRLDLLADRVRRSPRTPEGLVSRRLRRRERAGTLAMAGGLGLAFLAAASLAAPWLAERDVQRAADTWRSNPRKAFDQLDRAADLNPLSARPLLVSGSIALRLGREDIAERRFREALGRESDNPYPILELGLIAAERGDSRQAEARLGEALRLSPSDSAARRALRAVRAGRDVSVSAYNELILDEARRRVDER